VVLFVSTGCSSDSSSLIISNMSEETSLEKFESILREIIVPTSLDGMTKRLAREKLEHRLELPVDGLKARRNEINDLIDRIVSEVGGANADAQAAADKLKSEDADSKTHSASAIKGEHEGSGEGSDQEGGSASDSSCQETDSGASDNEGNRASKKRKAKSKAQPKKKVKEMQKSLMTKDSFLKLADKLHVKMGPLEFVMEPRKFNTGSVGWFYGSKVRLPVGDKEVHCQLTVNCAGLGSKEWKSGGSSRKSSAKAKVKDGMDD